MMFGLTADSGPERRLLLKAAIGGGAVVGAFAGASRLGLLGEEEALSGARPGLQLSSDGGSDIAALDLRLGDEYLPSVGPRRWRTKALPTSTHSMVGFTWQAGVVGPQIQISSRMGGDWGPWQHVPPLYDLPDEDTVEATDRLGTQVLWIGPADGIQVRVGGNRPEDLTLVLLHPARRAGDDERPDTRPRTVDPAIRGTTQTAARPVMRSRVDWGADEALRDGSPSYNATIEQVHVHHTVNSNDYGKADVPALIRGMYRYHTQNLGWSDLGYNFLVDRFGRIWVGRAGGAARPVRGAHTLGFNATSTGISAIGNFELVPPTAETLEAIAQVAAWKLSRYGRDANGTASVVSEGSDKFRPGKVVTLPVIDGHRDTNDTACPGSNLYAALPAIRSRAASIIAAAQQQPMTITSPSTLTGRPIIGRTLTVAPGVVVPSDAVASYTWMRNGAAIPGGTLSTYAPVADDVGAQLSVRVTYTRAGYLTTAEELTAGELTGAASITTVRSRGRVGRALISVEVAAVGLAATPTGDVLVRVNKRKKTVTLTDGRATARFVAFARGRYDVLAKFEGDAALLPSRDTDTVRVR
ncbi:N-acetylmuramoyl-L-alanine amidase [Nocardioides dilutus]